MNDNQEQMQYKLLFPNSTYLIIIIVSLAVMYFTDGVTGLMVFFSLVLGYTWRGLETIYRLLQEIKINQK